jgi:imidazolonepropionase-like amidohydrolase
MNAKTIITVAALCAALTAADTNRLFAGGPEIPAKPQDHPIVLTGGTIHPVSGPEIPNGMVLFDQGKIVAIGTDLRLPAGTERIDVTGKHVYPGLVLATSTTGLNEIGSVRATRDAVETGSINPNIRAEAGVNPESEIIPVTRANGVTVAMTMPGGGVISGTAAALELDGWTWEDMTLRAPVGMIVNWPGMTINTAWWETRTEEEQKKDRERDLDVMRNAFRDARAYMTAKSASAGGKAPHHDVDLRWESMIPVLEGKVPVILYASDLAQIQAAVAWADREKIRIVIAGGYDAWRAADLLKARGIPVIAEPITTTPSRRWEAYDEAYTLPKKLFDAGVTFCISGGGGYENERNLPYQAAMAASYGLPADEALKAITIYPARIFGIADRVGSIENGKDATLIVTTGNPLEITSSVEMEFIRGKKIQLTSRHTGLYEKYKEKYRRMGIE